MTSRALWPPQPFECMYKQVVAVAVVMEFLLLLEIRPLPLLLHFEILFLFFEIRPLSLLLLLEILLLAFEIRPLSLLLLLLLEILLLFLKILLLYLKILLLFLEILLLFLVRFYRILLIGDIDILLRNEFNVLH